MYCSRCGVQNNQGAIHCVNCGFILTEAPGGQTPGRVCAGTAPAEAQPVQIKTSRLAIWSMIMGILTATCILWPILALPAIICGIIALVKISGSKGQLKGTGLAVTGIVIPSIMTILLPMAIAAKNFMGQTEKARVTTTKATLMNLHVAANNFKMDTGRYPTEEEGLMALIEQPTDVDTWPHGGYLESSNLPRDAWKGEFIYMLNPEGGKPFVIISYGADGQEGGEGYDADIYSTDVE